MPFADLDAVTVDGYGTLLELPDPAGALVEALAAAGVARSREDVAAAFAAEARYYRPRSHLGRDAESLAALRRECVAVFLTELGADLDADTFVEAFVGSLVFLVGSFPTGGFSLLRGRSQRRHNRCIRSCGWHRPRCGHRRCR